MISNVQLEDGWTIYTPSLTKEQNKYVSEKFFQSQPLECHDLLLVCSCHPLPTCLACELMSSRLMLLSYFNLERLAIVNPMWKLSMLELIGQHRFTLKLIRRYTWVKVVLILGST